MPPGYLPQVGSSLVENQDLMAQARQHLEIQSLELERLFPQAACQDSVCPHARQALGFPPQGRFRENCHPRIQDIVGEKKSMVGPGRAAWTAAVEGGILSWIQNGSG